MHVHAYAHVSTLLYGTQVGVGLRLSGRKRGLLRVSNWQQKEGTLVVQPGCIPFGLERLGSNAV